MDQFLTDMTDTLGTLMVYQYELDAVVVKLEGVQRTNTVLAVLLVALVLGSASLTVWLVRRNRVKIRKRELANKLLLQQAAAMPMFTDKVNKLSAKGIKLSGRLYEEFQAAIDDVKRSSKMGFVEIVNDNDFAKQYPFLNDFPNLGVQEKIVLILVEEGFSTQDIALFLGISTNGVRAVKTKIRGKLNDSPKFAKYSKKMKILNTR